MTADRYVPFADSNRFNNYALDPVTGINTAFANGEYNFEGLEEAGLGAIVSCSTTEIPFFLIREQLEQIRDANGVPATLRNACAEAIGGFKVQAQANAATHAPAPVDAPQPEM